MRTLYIRCRRITEPCMMVAEPLGRVRCYITWRLHTCIVAVSLSRVRYYIIWRLYTCVVSVSCAVTWFKRGCWFFQEYKIELYQKVTRKSTIAAALPLFPWRPLHVAVVVAMVGEFCSPLFLTLENYSAVLWLTSHHHWPCIPALLPSWRGEG